eukprot:NODE_35_length_36362_cov_0.944434.p23 type:complete len:221 gc:universal NODE_35_length_36362_cov_0.944434:4959-5621(+)
MIFVGGLSALATLDQVHDFIQTVSPNQDIRNWDNSLQDKVEKLTESGIADSSVSTTNTTVPASTTSTDVSEPTPTVAVSTEQDSGGQDSQNNGDDSNSSNSSYNTYYVVGGGCGAVVLGGVVVFYLHRRKKAEKDISGVTSDSSYSSDVEENESRVTPTLYMSDEELQNCSARSSILRNEYLNTDSIMEGSVYSEVSGVARYSSISEPYSIYSENLSSDA